MKCLIDNDVVLARAPDGPLAAYIGTFAESQRTLGYAPGSIHRQALLAACFSHWLKRQGVALRQVRSDHTLRFLRCRARRVRIAPGNAAALRHLLEFLRGQGVIRAERIPVPHLTAVGRCVLSYVQYLRDMRALANATIVNYVPFVRGFLEHRFGDGPVRLARLSAGDVVRYVQRQAPRLHRKRAKLLTTALRSFLRYARYRGDVTLDLASVVPVVANWSMPSIPRAIGADQIHQLVASFDRHTVVGRRDYAIVLLLAQLGLRAGEVAFLDLEDLDWKAGQVRVRGKGGHRTALPLPPAVGEAIATYLRHGRPFSDSSRVFLRSKAPIRGFLNQSSVGSIVQHALQRAGIQAPSCGAHQFRHAMATQMLRGGASLAEIGEILRHRSPQTTMIYTKVDIQALRSLALAWPGGAR